MIVLTIAAVVLMVLGVYFCLVGSWSLPIRQKPIKISTTTKAAKQKKIDAVLINAAKKVAPFIKMNKFKRANLSRALAAIKSALTPEEYVATTWIYSAALVLTGIASLYIHWIVAVAIWVFAYYNHQKSNKRVLRLYRNKRDEIEGELPRFVSFIDQKIEQQDTNVLGIIEEYKLTDNQIFAAELEHTLADMQTSSFENGLQRWNQRIASEKLTMVVRGMLGLVRGEEQGLYFKMLKRDLNTLEINALKQSASGRQKKISSCNWMLITSIIITLFTPLVITVVDSFKLFFG